MTAQEKLIERVKQMTDEEAEDWLFRVDEKRANERPVTRETPPTHSDQPQTLLEVIHAVACDISPEEWATSPGDLAEQVDHYAYSLPKR